VDVLGQTKTTGIHFLTNPDLDDSVFYEALALEEEHWQRFVKGSVAKLSDLPQYPLSDFWDLYYVEEEDAWYENWFIGWYEWTDNERLLREYFYKYPMNLEISTPFSTLIDDNGWLAVGNKYSDMKKITPRLFFVKIEDQGGYNQMVGKVFDDELNLYWYNEPAGAAEGMFSRFWKRYAAWIQTRKNVDVVKKMTLLDIVELDMAMKYTIAGNDYVINNVKITFTKDEIKPVKLNLYSVI
jgi:hypothetical protein